MAHVELSACAEAGLVLGLLVEDLGAKGFQEDVFALFIIAATGGAPALGLEEERQVIDDHFIAVVEFKDLVFIDGGGHAAGIGPADHPVHGDGPGDHGVTELAASLVVADQDAIAGIAALVVVDILLFDLGNEVEEDGLGLPRPENADSSAFYAVLDDVHVAEGVVEVLLEEYALVTDKSRVFLAGEGAGRVEELVFLVELGDVGG